MEAYLNALRKRASELLVANASNDVQHQNHRFDSLVTQYCDALTEHEIIPFANFLYKKMKSELNLSSCYIVMLSCVNYGYERKY